MDRRGQRLINSFVIDACVITEWVLHDEAYVEKALRLRDSHVLGMVNLFAPDILKLEVVNTLWKAVKFERIKKEDAYEALKAVSEAEIALYCLDWMPNIEVLKIASKLDIAGYDAAYIYLSNKLKVPLITCDTKLYEKAKDQFNVLHLKDYL